MSHTVIAELVARSNRLGSNPNNTNYAGGNTPQPKAPAPIPSPAGPWI